MLGVGWTEMLVIGVVALIVIGPKDLPEVMRRIGKFAGTIRRMGSDFQRELNKTTGLDEIRNLRQAVTAPLKATTDAIRKEFNTTTSSGAVQPSGALKPADPKVESVVSAIEEKAGIAKPPVMTGALPAKPVVPPAVDTEMEEAVVARPRSARKPKAPAAKPAAAPAAAAKPKSTATARKPAPSAATQSPAPAAARPATRKAAAKPAATKAKPATAKPKAAVANGAAEAAVPARPKAATRRKSATGDTAKNA